MGAGDVSERPARKNLRLVGAQDELKILEVRNR
jgi:hypothetical protein